MLFLHPQGDESSYSPALQEPWSQCFLGQCCRAEEAGFILAAGLGRAFSREHRLVAQGSAWPMAQGWFFTLSAPLVQIPAAAGLVQDLPLWLSISLPILVK